MKLFFTEWDIDERLERIKEDFPSFDKRFSPSFEIKYKCLFEFFQNHKESKNILTLKYIKESIFLDKRRINIFILEGFKEQVIDILLKKNTSI